MTHDRIVRPTAAEVDIERAACELQIDQAERDAQHYRNALVEVLKQALSIEELEALAFGVQHALERRAVDQDTAAHAVVAYVERTAPALRRRSASALTHAERMESERLAILAEQYAARWRARCPAAFTTRSNG